MKVKKLLVSLSLIILFFAASLFGAILYFYYHPASVKPLIEKILSESTGTRFAIKGLSYSLKPLRFQAKGITSVSQDVVGGLQMKISHLVADAALKGPFGRKILTFKSFKLEGFDLKFSDNMDMAKIRPKKTRPSFFARVLKGAIALLLFREIKFQAVEMEGGTLTAQFEDYQMDVRGIHVNLTEDHLLEISCGTKIQWPNRKMGLFAPYVNIRTDRRISLVDPEMGGTLIAKNAAFYSPRANFKNLSTEAKLHYSRGHKRFTFQALDLRVEEITLKGDPEWEMPPLNLKIQAQGAFNLKEKGLRAASISVNLGDTLFVKGQFDLGLAPRPIFRLTIQNGHFMPRKLRVLLPEEIRAKLRPASISGPINLLGSIDAEKSEQEWGIHADLRAVLKANPFSYASGQIRLAGKCTGEFGARGKFPDMAISARIEADETSLSGLGVQLEPFEVGIGLTGIHPVYRIKDLKIRIPQAEVAAGKRPVRVTDIRAFSRKGGMDVRSRSFFLSDLRLDTSLLQNIRVSLKADQKGLTVDILGDNVHLLGAAHTLNLWPPGWQFEGRDSIQLRAALTEDSRWTFSSRLRFENLGFQNQDGRYAGEKIALDLKTEGVLNLKDFLLAARTTLKAHKGEVLYDRFYLDLNSNALFSSFSGKYDYSEKFLGLSGIELGLTDIFALDMSGTYVPGHGGRRLRLKIRIPGTPLRPLFQHFIFEPFKTEKPFLSTIQLGGTISAHLDLMNTGADWRVKGRCSWDEGELSSASSGVYLRGIHLDLPVWYQTFETPAPLTSPKGEQWRAGQGEGGKERSLKGSLAIRSALLPFLPEQSLRAPLDAGPNRLSVRVPTILRVPGGKIQLGPLVGRSIYGPRPSIETSLTVQSLELQPLLSRIWPEAIGGSVEGKLDPVHLEGSTISSQGEIRAEAFGGEIILFDMGGKGFFTSAPQLTLSARIKDLSLEALTTGTSFGRIDGVLQGHITGLDIAYGQPQKFELLLETVKKRGAPQKISVKAVDNIAQIGGGQSPFMGLAGMISTFFKEFPYKKIGIRASLENDFFRINGTIQEKGTEYLLKGGGIPVINIVNRDPDNRIGFKDMVKRIKRVTASKGGPVVK